MKIAIRMLAVACLINALRAQDKFEIARIVYPSGAVEKVIVSDGEASFFKGMVKNASKLVEAGTIQLSKDQRKEIRSLLGRIPRQRLRDPSNSEFPDRGAELDGVLWYFEILQENNQRKCLWEPGETTSSGEIYKYLVGIVKAKDAAE